MLNILNSIVLGAVQGLTEWLPVSSSGHLVLAQKLMNLQVPVSFDILLHFASLLVIIFFFRQDISKIANSWFKWKTKTEEFRFGLLIIISTIATAVVVLPFKSIMEQAFSNLLIISVAFFVTFTLLLFSELSQKNKTVSFKSAIIIGLMQGIAFIPGISRSGSTIATAFILGIKKEEAFRFSFILAIPAILASSILKIPELVSSNVPLLYLNMSFLSALVVSFFTLIALKKIIIKDQFHYFAYYCFAISLITLIYSQVG